MTIGCGKYSETQWQDYLLGDRSASMTSHFETCPSCQNDLAGLEATIFAVKQTPLDHAAVRAVFVDRVMAEVGETLRVRSAAAGPETVGPLAASRRSSRPLRWPSSWRAAAPILALACVALFILWSGSGIIDSLFPVKSGAPITSSPYTFQIASDVNVLSPAESSLRTFALDDDMMGMFAAESDMMSTFMAEANPPDMPAMPDTFAAEIDMMSTFSAEAIPPDMPAMPTDIFAAEIDMMSSFAAEIPDDVGPLLTFQAMSIAEEATMPIATPDGVTNASSTERQGWRFTLRRLPEAMPLSRPSGVTTSQPTINDML